MPQEPKLPGGCALIILAFVVVLIVQACWSFATMKP